MREADRTMADTPVTFETPKAFRTWLRAHHAGADALLVRIAKKHAAHTGITYGDALDQALCFGWIDGVRRSLDPESFSIRFSPRKRGSIWSLVNVRHAERLIASGEMTKAGLVVFEARRPDRTGLYSFEQPPQEFPAEILKRFKGAKAAWMWWAAQAPYYRRVCTHWVLRAKQAETRERRLLHLIDCCAAGQPVSPMKHAKVRASPSS